MRRFLTTVFVLAMLGNANAQNAPSDYRQVMRDCGTQWKASDERKAVAKGQGAEAWQNFRRDCVKRSGYVAKRSRTAAAPTTN
jgi:hypothetical protein